MMHEPTVVTRRNRGLAADSAFLPQPTSVQDTGLEFGLLLDLCIKTLYYESTPSAGEICNRMALPFVIVDELLRFLRRQSYVEVVGASGFGDQEYRYSLTGRGTEKAHEVLELSQYVGPAPVPLDQYVEVVRRQSIRNIELAPATVHEALSKLVLDDSTLDQLGTAIGSGRSIFLYGDSGNGKSTIAGCIRDMLTGDVLVPHAIEAYGQIIKVFDPRVHFEAETEDARPAKTDRRWVLCSRPVVTTGGGLQLQDLELRYTQQSNYYIAPLQLKAMNGVLLLDDFGRQLVSPEALLNRWIVPVEEGVDHLALHSGPMVELPFDVMLIFATNLTPSKLGDESFFRRIRHKVRVGDPTEASFREILRRAAAKAGIEYSEAGASYLVDTYYKEGWRPFRGCHGRDICDLMNDIGKFRGEQPEFTPPWIDIACSSYFVTD